MSTCPRCRQYLGEHHRCPRWVRWRRPMVRAAFATLGAMIGTLIGLAIGPPFDIIFLAAGAFAGYRIAPRRRRDARSGRDE